ncbi:hypothetical protein [Pseudomonas sp. 6D_7.1_Bac1]|uniref:hypothetical protein n=1 Tax=Pseudomonas sp. 6D_7.1_Bac1 TaxID=2971615 RepID=UPI0021C887D3|nr:hypothetical protein [Pseudomonas sp. 6D_7.1_Bac1]MCU1750072.1 hypothetical protein [Pseudomonas sp. 6D_7.1_Bac1]
MAVRKTKGNMKAKAKPFAMVLWTMGQSAPYRSLSFVARCVLMELHMQYNGNNNGNLAATRTMAKEWGVSSPNILQKALADLLTGGWIIQTRSSLFSRHGSRCALYALSWYAIDECPGKDLEVSWTHAPPKTVRELTNSN